MGGMRGPCEGMKVGACSVEVLRKTGMRRMRRMMRMRATMRTRRGRKMMRSSSSSRWKT
jgi:hypothetical protein